MRPAAGDYVMIEAPRAGGVDLARVVRTWTGGWWRGKGHTAVLAEHGYEVAAS